MWETLGIVGIVASFVAFGVFLVWRHHRLRTENDDLLERGTPMQARVVRVVREPGEDDLYRVTLALDGGPPIEVRWFLLAHMLPVVQPDRTVAVRVDATRSRAAFDPAAMRLA